MVRDCWERVAEGGMSRWKWWAILRPGWVEMWRLVNRASDASGED